MNINNEAYMHAKTPLCYAKAVHGYSFTLKCRFWLSVLKRQCTKMKNIKKSAVVGKLRISGFKLNLKKYLN